jgi:hypothetical protein
MEDQHHILDQALNHGLNTLRQEDTQFSLSTTKVRALTVERTAKLSGEIGV